MTTTMKRIAAMCLAATLAAAAVAVDIQWAKSYEDAVALAQKGNKLIMIDFYTEWCGWCKKLDQDTFSDAKVAKAAGKFASVKVDAEKEGEELAKKYDVQGYPTILFVDANGEVFGRIGGYMPPEPFMKELDKMATAYERYPRNKAALEKDPNHVDALGGMITIYAARGDRENAESHLQRLEATGEKGAKLLGKAYNDVGDMHQHAERLTEAIGYFEKAAEACTEDEDIAYALVSIAVCRFEQDRAKDAVAPLKRAKGLKNLSEETRKMIDGMLEAAEKGG